MTEKLFTPLQAGALKLRNRVVMAPLTRNRALKDGDIPGPLAAEYYGQRAGAGLIISEGTQVSRVGQGYVWTPGMYSEAQIDGWRSVTEAVHAKGGTIVAQIWHVGRVSNVALQPGGAAPVAPSALRAEARTYIASGFAATSAPRALEIDEIPGVVAEYAAAARNAREAGFDGIEIHGANGYLIDQFMRPSANRRSDAYGGSIENRTRFLEEVVAAVAEAIGADRVGLRLSPFSPANGVVVDETAQDTFARGIERIAPYGLAYLHMVEGVTHGTRDIPEGTSIAALRALFPGVYIANNAYDRDLAIEAVETGAADAVAFGKAFLANPDLVERLRRNAPLNAPVRETFYGGGAEGYTDYPTLEQLSVTAG